MASCSWITLHKRCNSLMKHVQNCYLFSCFLKFCDLQIQHIIINYTIRKNRYTCTNFVCLESLFIFPTAVYLICYYNIYSCTCTLLYVSELLCWRFDHPTISCFLNFRVIILYQSLEQHSRTGFFFNVLWRLDTLSDRFV